MSVSRVVIPVLDLEQNDDPSSKVVLKGAKQVSLQRIQANSATVSEATFNWQPPSQNTVIDRRIDLVCQFSVNLGGTDDLFKDKFVAANNAIVLNQDTGEGSIATVGYPEVVGRQVTYAGGGSTTAANSNKSIGMAAMNRCGNNFALRQLPLQSVTDNLDVTINGTHFSTDPANYIKAVQQYMSPEYREKVFKGTAHHPDTYAGNYVDAFLNANQVDFMGCANSLSRQHATGRQGETPNGVFLNDVGTGGILQKGTAANTGNITLLFTLREPLLISPLCANYGKGMTNINNIDVAIKFKSAISKLFSLFLAEDSDFAKVSAADPLTLAAITDTITLVPDSAFLEVRNYTAQDDIKIPNEIILPYHQPRRFETDIASTAAGNSVSSITSNRRLDQIPECVYLWVAEKRSEITNANAPNKSDGMFQPTKVSVNWGNQVGILSGMTEYQLFELACENGCDLLDLNEARRKGYCLKLVFGKDIPLMDNESAGTRGDYNIQIEITARNGSKQAIVTSFTDMYVNLGQVIISPNECRVQTGLLDLKDNIEAENQGHSYHVAGDITGGGLFSALGKFAKKVPHLAKSVVKHAPHLVKTARALNEVRKDPSMANVMAAGTTGMASYKSMKGGSSSGGSIVGGSASGGSMSGGSYRSRRM